LTEADLADLQKFIVGDSVTACIKIKLGDSVDDFDDFDNKEPEVTSTETDQPAIHPFMENLSKIYSKGHHDLKIQADGKEFKAIKHVLMSHSEIFEVMLSSPHSIEAQTNLIKIENIGADIIEALVKWMHFLKLDNLDEIACDLYKAAHKYQILPLMEICTQAMSHNLSVENLVTRVILAYVYEVEELKDSILRFVQQGRRNTRILFASKEWFGFGLENHELAMKIADELCK